jgi:hypothetical protein
MCFADAGAGPIYQVVHQLQQHKVPHKLPYCGFNIAAGKHCLCWLFFLETYPMKMCFLAYELLGLGFRKRGESTTLLPPAGQLFGEAHVQGSSPP